MIKPSVSLFKNLKNDEIEFSVVLEQVTQSNYKRLITVSSSEISFIGVSVLNFIFIN
jgi:hypothetical protein